MKTHMGEKVLYRRGAYNRRVRVGIDPPFTRRCFIHAKVEQRYFCYLNDVVAVEPRRRKTFEEKIWVFPSCVVSIEFGRLRSSLCVCVYFGIGFPPRC